MSHKKPPPLRPDERPRKSCPVCGETSYSKAGIHPQCAQKRYESQRLQKVKAPPAGAEKPTKGSPWGRWEKACPKCGARIHSRKKACDCGHVFGRPGA